jgi:hypothetical protein
MMRKVLSISFAFLIALSFLGYFQGASVHAAESGDQGCVNQGGDRRLAARVVCPAQQYLSWKSNNRPHFVSFGNPYYINVGVAWPPYLVINRYHRPGEWQMFRIGFRYDLNWRGYIFPTTALKVVSHPLRY